MKTSKDGKKGKSVSSGVPSKQVRTGNGKIAGGKRFEDDADEFWRRERKRQRMQVRILHGKLVIVLPLIDPPHLSQSGKSHLVATTSGVKRTPLLVDECPVHVVASAFIYRDWSPPAKFVPLFDLPKREEEEGDEAEGGWKTIPLLE
jgi:hypothetical protein